MIINTKFKNIDELELYIVYNILVEQEGENYSEKISDMAQIKMQTYLKYEYNEYKNNTIKNEYVCFAYEEWLTQFF